MEKITYQISSRAAILLGRESVSKVDGAIIELVKNTYDADASFCILAFDVEHDAIYIIDNGIGMTRDTIQSCWMLIGTDNKKVVYKSKKNRIKSGEKGIGRFALDRLGEICEMYTKHDSSDKTLYWKTDWRNFEQTGKVINEVAADLDFLDDDLRKFLPAEVIKNLDCFDKELVNIFKTGTILKITNLRDNWTNKAIEKIINMLSYAMPNNHLQDYSLYAMRSFAGEMELIENEMINEFDYKLNCLFDGEYFKVELTRNEFDISKIPNEVFKMEEFQKYPYRKEDFEDGKFYFVYPIEEIAVNDDKEVIETIKKIGVFQFEYVFLKANAQEDYKEVYYYKEISNKRRAWLLENAGVKIYRDNFIIRPYGDNKSDAFDWLNLDARKASSSAAVSDPRGSWRVRNMQGYGSVSISRIHNSKILDKSSREGIIDNEYFLMFKKVLANLINLFEEDRQHIARGFKKYDDKINEVEIKKEKGRKVAKTIMSGKYHNADEKENPANEPQQDDTFDDQNNNQDTNSELAEALLLIDKEKNDLLTEIKLLRSLATNGLITTSIVHDLSGLNTELKQRANRFKYVIDKNDKELINDYLEDLGRNDLFLNSWINVVITQLKQDKRKRKLTDLYLVLENLKLILSPLLAQKNIKLNIIGERNIAIKKIFSIDFESIICNLIINSIEAFKRIQQQDKKITITLSADDENIKINYKDNGPGISKSFKDPSKIFEFGVTDKMDKNTGEIIGTGLGMYIVATAINEYGGNYSIINSNGFELEILISNERNNDGDF